MFKKIISALSQSFGSSVQKDKTASAQQIRDNKITKNFPILVNSMQELGGNFTQEKYVNATLIEVSAPTLNIDTLPEDAPILRARQAINDMGIYTVWLTHTPPRKGHSLAVDEDSSEEFKSVVNRAVELGLIDSGKAKVQPDPNGAMA